MAVNSLITVLEKLDAFPTKPLLERFATRLFERINALYEATGDIGAPGAASQTITGHNHSTAQGGAPIPRSSILCVDLVSDDFGELNLTEKNKVLTRDIGIRYLSPGIAWRDGSTFTEIVFCANVVGGAIEVWANAGEAQKIKIEPTKTNELRWFTILCPVLRDDIFEPLTFSIRLLTDEKTTYWFTAIEEAETIGASIHELGYREITSSIGSVGEVLAYFGTEATLDSDLVDALHSLDSYTLKILMWSLNALFSWVLDEAPPGAGTQTIKGHDHFKFIAPSSGGFGGTPIPKSSILSVGNPHKDLMTCNTTVLNQWEYTDLSNSAPIRRSTGTPNATTGAGATNMFLAYVSPGLTSSGNPPTSNPFLVAYAHIGGIVAGCELRIYNATASALSPVVAASTTTNPDGWIIITKVPCVGGVWNEFTLQIRSTATASNTYQVRQFGIWECYTDGTEDASIVDSSGIGLPGVTRSGTQKNPED